jgi:hypothetical protein
LPSDEAFVQQLLAVVATFEQPPERRRRVLQAMLHVDLILELARLDPAGERADRFRSAIEHEKTLHASTLHDQVEVVLRSRQRLRRVVVRDPAAKHHTPRIASRARAASSMSPPTLSKKISIPLGDSSFSRA